MHRHHLSLGALALASTSLSIFGCGSSGASPTVTSAPVTDASAFTPDGELPTEEAGIDADDAGNDAGVSEAAPTIDAPSADAHAAPSSPSTPSTFIRLANWTPDAPNAGFDACLAPFGTTNWVGPLLAQKLPPGALGQGGANGLQFPNVTQYFGVASGDYDIQIIAAGTTDCTMGVLPPTVLPTLSLNAHTTIATVGDVNPRGNDTGLKVTVFFDDWKPPSSDAAMRVINTIPSVAYLDFGSGSLTAGNFSPLVIGAGFGVVGINLASGEMAGLTGYFNVHPVADGRFSAHPTGTSTKDTATATHVTLTGGSVTTMVVINGSNGGFPPQFLVCTDSAPPRDSQTPCQVFAQ